MSRKRKAYGPPVEVWAAAARGPFRYTTRPVEPTEAILDGWKRPALPGDLVCTQEGTGTAVAFPKGMFSRWFEPGDEGGFFVERSIRYLLNLGTAFQIWRTTRTVVDFFGPNPGFRTLANQTILLERQCVLVAHLLHDKATPGAHLISLAALDSVVACCDPAIRTPWTPRQDPVTLRYYLARSKGRFNATKLASVEGVTTLFGDPARIGDWRVEPTAADTESYVVPEPLFARCFERLATGLYAKRWDAHLYQFSCPFNLTVNGQTIEGAPDSVIAVEYDLLGVASPRIVSVFDMTRRFELSD